MKKDKGTLSIIKKMISDGCITQDVAEKYFPELAESEDEKIRKELINYIQSEIDFVKSGEPEAAGLSIDFLNNTLAWLEKQGEQNPIERHAFEIGDTITDGNSVFTIVDIKDEHYIADDGDKVCFYVVHRYYTPYKEQKLVWSKDDEYQYNTILHKLNMRKYVYEEKGNKEEAKRYEVQYNWLKSLKNRVQPQPKQEWSEEDEHVLCEIIDKLRSYQLTVVGVEYERCNEVIEWLKERFTA